MAPSYEDIGLCCILKRKDTVEERISAYDITGFNMRIKIKAASAAFTWLVEQQINFIHIWLRHPFQKNNLHTSSRLFLIYCQHDDNPKKKKKTFPFLF